MLLFFFFGEDLHGEGGLAAEGTISVLSCGLRGLLPREEEAWGDSETALIDCYLFDWQYRVSKLDCRWGEFPLMLPRLGESDVVLAKNSDICVDLTPDRVSGERRSIVARHG